MHVKTILFPSFTKTKWRFSAILLGFYLQFVSVRLAVFFPNTRVESHEFKTLVTQSNLLNFKINIILKNDINACYSKLSKELRNNIKILSGQTVLELLIWTTLWLFDPFAITCIYYFQRCWLFEVEHKIC